MIFKKGKKVEFKKVLLVNDDKTVEIGDPTVSGAIVEGLLLDNIKDRKVIVFKKEEDKIQEKVTGIDSLYPKFRLQRFCLKMVKLLLKLKKIKLNYLLEKSR